MAHRKAGGSAKNLRDSKPKFLGIKLTDGETATAGAIIVRQRGTRIEPGKNVRLAKDHSIFSLKDGIVSFRSRRKSGFDGRLKTKKVVDVN